MRAERNCDLSSEKEKRMTEQKKQEYVNRIIGSNPTEIIVTLFDIFSDYVTEARKGYMAGEHGNEESREALDKASEVLKHLKSDLDFSVDKELCGRLYSIYQYAGELIAKTIYSGSFDHAQAALELLAPLRAAFDQISSEDKRGNGLENLPQRVAGMTYGRAGLDEAELGDESNRGYLV